MNNKETASTVNEVTLVTRDMVSYSGGINMDFYCQNCTPLSPITITYCNGHIHNF